jgi:hypothetical protein
MSAANLNLEMFKCRSRSFLLNQPRRLVSPRVTHQLVQPRLYCRVRSLITSTAACGHSNGSKCGD